MRVFIGIDLPESVKKELGRLVEKLEKKHWKVRWVEREKLHLTLVFLGKIEEKKVKELKEGIEGAIKERGEIGGIRVSFKGLGVFPDYDYPRVIWLGLKGDLKSLAALQKAIEDKLIEHGFEIKKRKFYPHLTLGRIRPVKFAERKEIGRQLRGMKEINFKTEIAADKVTVFESKLSPKGARYRKLAEYRIRG